MLELSCLGKIALVSICMASIQTITWVYICTKYQYVTGISILIPMGSFVDTIVEVDYWYYAFTYIPDWHWWRPTSDKTKPISKISMKLLLLLHAPFVFKRIDVALSLNIGHAKTIHKAQSSWCWHNSCRHCNQVYGMIVSMSMHQVPRSLVGKLFWRLVLATWRNEIWGAVSDQRTPFRGLHSNSSALDDSGLCSSFHNLRLLDLFEQPHTTLWMEPTLNSSQREWHSHSFWSSLFQLSLVLNLNQQRRCIVQWFHASFRLSKH